ncbi:MAG: pilus assembly protein [Proteobacteria bacterium]|mgnify:FL=1|jgi:Flp pilus assembly protein TadG|nr:MAG: pilus assembly protein [Pseudomonadota bacterium]
MAFRAGTQHRIARIRTGIARFGRDCRGIAAIEFAFIAPILLAMYFLTMEVSQAIETNKKLNRVSLMVGDLVTQQDSITKSELDAIMKIADSSLLPYHRSTPKITVTGISIGGSPLKATVKWSRKVQNNVYSADSPQGTTTTVPASLMVPNTFLVQVKTELAYKPVIAWAADSKSVLGLEAAFDSISMSETFHLRPRMTNEINCADCYK